MDDFSKSGKVEFPVIGMNCGGCAKKVKRHLEEVDGVVNADVSHESKNAVVEFDPGKTDVEALKSVVTGLDYKVEWPESEQAEFGVYGMTCGGCSGKVQKALAAAEGVISADVSHEEDKATVVFDPSKTDIGALKAIAVETGYALEPKVEGAETVDFDVYGMTCGGCSGKVKKALEAVDGVISADISHEEDKATIEYDPAKTGPEALKAVVVETGYTLEPKAKEAPASETAEFGVYGMTCGHCSGTVTEALEAVDGVTRADVSHEEDKATVEFDPSKTGIGALKAAVVEAGYALEPTEEPAEDPAGETAAPEIKFAEGYKINITGMTCSSCAGRIETALNEAEGIEEASVNLALENATINYDPAKISAEEIKKIVADTGYGAEEVKKPGAGGHATLDITGMTCSSCSGRIETALNAAPGVSSATVNLAIENATIDFDPTVTSAAALVKVVEEAGYGARIKDESDDDGAEEKERLKKMRYLLIFSALLTAPLVAQMISVFLNLGFHLKPWMEVVLATPVQFYVGARYYVGAWHAFKAKAGNMDMLVAIGTTAAYFYSLWLVYTLGSAAQGALYFEASTVVITLVLAGKYMENSAKRSASSALRQLLGLRPTSATILTADGEVVTPIDQVKIGDVALLRPGGRVPVDGVIIEGESELDEALITGESMPVLRRVGDEVIAGAINGGGVLKIETTRVGEDTTLAKVASMVESAQVGKAPIQKLVDQISAIFVPTIIVIAIVTFIVWMMTGASFETSIVAMISVLVIACPCALGLATPTALVAGTGSGAKAGILIRDIETLERAKTIDAVVFDKTGTLTEGKPTVAAIRAFEGDEESLLALGAAAQSGSEHPLGKAIVAEAEARGITPPAAKDARATAGEGIEVSVDGETIRMGRGRFAVADMDPAQEKLALDMREGGRTVVWLSKGGRAVGLVAYTDPIRPEAKAAVAQLHKRGVEAYLMTGDNAETAAKVAAELGIDKVIADMRPEDKAREVKALQEGGKHVAMVGDGVNDAPALAEATLGIAMGGGADVAIETAGFVLMRNDPQLVAAALDVSAKTATKIKQNLFWAFAYNTVGIPVAALGFLNPAVAGAAMAFSSVFVVTNSLLLKRWKPEVGK